MHIYIYIYTHTRICTHTHAQMRAYLYAHVRCMYISINAYAQRCTANLHVITTQKQVEVPKPNYLQTWYYVYIYIWIAYTTVIIYNQYVNHNSWVMYEYHPHTADNNLYVNCARLHTTSNTYKNKQRRMLLLTCIKPLSPAFCLGICLLASTAFRQAAATHDRHVPILVSSSRQISVVLALACLFPMMFIQHSPRNARRISSKKQHTRNTP